MPLEILRAIICSDVLEHVLPPLEKSLAGLFYLLKPGGTLIATVPIVTSAQGIHEKYPNLHNFHFFTNHDGVPCLENITIHGETEIYENPIFHGGGGSTLEIRHFSLTGAYAALSEIGFIDIEKIDYVSTENADGVSQMAHVILAKKPLKSFSSIK